MRIFKYPIDLKDEQFITLPADSMFLCAQYQGETLCIWALVTEDSPMVQKTIHIVGTGHRAKFYSLGEPWVYLSTVQKGGYVWHVFTDSK